MRASKGLLAAAAVVAAGCGGGGSGAGADADGGAGANSGGGADAGMGAGGDDGAGAGADSSSGGRANGESGAGGGTYTDSATRADAASDSSSSTSSTSCGAGDTKLPAEPTIPAACATLTANQAVAAGGVPSETTLDTARIQSALAGCASGQALKLAASGTNGAFVTGPITIPSGVTLWVDAGATLYGTRSPAVYGSAQALITVTGAGSGIVGDGVIDGQGGEPKIGASGSFWDANGSGGSSPALIRVSGATNFTLYRITLHDAPMFHVKLGAAGFVVWGVTIKTPSKLTNSQGTSLTPAGAHNTDGIDPGEAASNGYVVCSSISDGDDQIAIKGGTGVDHLVIAHDRFGAGHGMSIGSETNGGVSNVDVYDLAIDGTGSGLGGGSSNGIRIKSDSSRGGSVTAITYTDVCVRGIANPILITPRYTTATGSLIPDYTGITIRDFHSVGTSVAPHVTIEGYDAAHATGLTLDNVVVDGLAASAVTASYADVTLGPGAVSFTPSGTGVTVHDNRLGASTPNPCTNKWGP
jgi:polygalacturonase